MLRAGTRVGLVCRSRTYFKKKTCNIEKSEACNQFQLKIIKWFSWSSWIWPRYFNLSEEYREYTTSIYLLSVDSQHNNCNSVINWMCHAKNRSRGCDTKYTPLGSCTICQNPDYYFGIAHPKYNTII